MSPVKYSNGVFTRLEIPIPIFLQEDPFDPNVLKIGGDYHWLSKKPMQLFVKNRPVSSMWKMPINSNADVMNDSSNRDNIVIVTGNPLECPFDVFEKFDTESDTLAMPEALLPFSRLEFSFDDYELLNEHEARTVLLKLQTGDKKCLEDFELSLQTAAENPICFVCDTASNKNLVLNSFFKKSCSKLRIIEHTYDELNSFTLTEFFRQHTPVRRDLIEDLYHGRPFQTQLHVVYQILDSDATVEGKVFFEFAWPEPDPAMFYSPPPEQARSKITICPKPGDASSDLKKFYTEVIQLEELITLHETDQCPENHRTYYHHHQNTSSGDLDESDYAKRIQDLVQQPATTCWSLLKDSGAPIPKLVQSILVADRADVDFTDKAWAVLKDASGIPALFEGIFQIFTTIERGYWRPYVLPNNKSSFGNIVKDLRTEKLGNFRTILTPNLALELTIEFGLMKLERDFLFLCTMSQLMDMNEVPTTPNIKNYREGLFNIQKLFCLIELIYLARNRLGIPSSDHQYFTQCILKQFPNKGPFDWKKVYHFDYPNDQILPLLGNKEPVYWNLRMETKSAVRVAVTNFIFSRDILLPHLQTPEKIQIQEKDAPPAKRPWYRYAYRTVEHKV